IDFSDGHALGPDEFSVDENADRLGRVCENVLVQRSDRVFRFYSTIDHRLLVKREDDEGDALVLR
ncbi:hypothetical protein U1Q18_046726, partial [Sarracenia purpurea var. burkii]